MDILGAYVEKNIEELGDYDRGIQVTKLEPCGWEVTETTDWARRSWTFRHGFVQYSEKNHDGYAKCWPREPHYKEV